MLKDITSSFTYLPEDTQIKVYERFKRANVRDKLLFFCFISHGSEIKNLELSEIMGLSPKGIHSNIRKILKGERQ